MSTERRARTGHGARSRVAIWRAVAAFISAGSLVLGGLMLAAYLRERQDVADRVAERTAPRATSATRTVKRDPRMRPYLRRGVAWSAVREMPFGANRSLFSAGPSRVPPQELFVQVMDDLRKGVTDKDLGKLIWDPSAAAALRMQATVGIFEGVAFLVRVPPDLEQVLQGRLVMEPGGMILGYQRDGETWEYVHWFFPQGLDLDAFMDGFAPPKGVLEEVSPTLEDHLEPALVIAPDPGALNGAPASSARRGPKTIFCRTHGRVDRALAAAGRVLARDGWTEIQKDVSPSGAELRILRRGGTRRSIWLHAEDRMQSGGIVTVLVATP